MQQDSIPDAQIQPVDIILVVERGCGDHGTGQAHRLHDDFGRQDSGAAHLHHDVQHLALLFLRRVFEGHRPTGRLGGAAQSLALGQRVDFDDGAVHIKGQLASVLPQPLDPLHAVPDVVIVGVADHREAHLPHGVQGLGVSGVAAAGAELQIEADDVQLSGGRHLGIQLPHGACSRVSGIGKQRLAADLPLGVQLLKDGLGHIHLAPDDETLRRVLDVQRKGAHSAQILRHILAGDAVAPGSAADEDAVFVLQGHGKPVDLGLHHIVVLPAQQ